MPLTTQDEGLFATSNDGRTEEWIKHSSLVICQTTGSKPLPKRFLHIVRSRASSFNWQYPLLSLRSSSNFLRLLPRLLVTYICPVIFPSITCRRRQFLRKMWPIQLAFRFLISSRILNITQHDMLKDQKTNNIYFIGAIPLSSSKYMYFIV